jgi:hypothetical protein
MDWGMAEEAGRAARWLEHQSLPGLEALAGLLTWGQSGDWRGRMPAPKAGQTTCPIACGTTLSDRGELSDPFSSRVRMPLLMLPALSDLADDLDTTVVLAWPGGTVGIAADGSLVGDVDALARTEEAVVKAHLGSIKASPWLSGGLSSSAATSIKTLEELAMRTTVPATAASRADAGAATTDND